MAPRLKPDLFIIAAAYEEEQNIAPLVDELRRVVLSSELLGRYVLRVILIDDGSRDQTYLSIYRQTQRADLGFELVGLRLSRNFGQQSAVHSGLDYAFKRSGRDSYFVILDSDLQHPPSLIPSILEHLSRGVDHVQMVRENDEGVSFFKALTSRWFYRIFKSVAGFDIPMGGSDYRGFSRKFLEAYLALPEKNRFNRGLFCWLGFESLRLPYQPLQRARGRSKYTLARMSRLAFTGLTYFSSKPLILGLSCIVLTSLIFCGGYFLFETFRYFSGKPFAVGWPTLFFFISFWGGITALSQLLIGIYLCRVFDEVKGRPGYVVSDSCGSLTQQPTLIQPLNRDL